MSDLDDKLTEILDVVWGAALDYSTSPDLRNQQGMLNEAKYLKAKKNTKSYAITQLKQAFADEGWIKIPQIREIKGKIETSHNFVDINNMRYMTGVEFYQRYKKLSDENEKTDIKLRPDGKFGYKEFGEALARKAAGLE